MTPKVRYQADKRREGFRPDPAQAEVVEHTQRLYADLVTAPKRSRWWSVVSRRPSPIRGLYLWGGPGRGKTYLVDSFYNCLPFGEKRRVHFHRFMLGVHRRLDGLPRTPNPLKVIARQLAAEVRVLCLDEFHVYDIADAMLLHGLLEALFNRGITLVATSNSPPAELYPDGLQRDRFLAAIECIEQNAEVVELKSGEDFRRARLERGGTYLVSSAGEARVWLERHIKDLEPQDLRRGSTIQLNGRPVKAVAEAAGLSWFEFGELCDSARSTPDYLELAQEFHTLLLEDIPLLGEGREEAARRFVHLIDALYDHRVKLVVSAAAEPERLYQGRQLRGLFERTASRLAEMRTRKYLHLPHRPNR